MYQLKKELFIFTRMTALPTYTHVHYVCVSGPHGDQKWVHEVQDLELQTVGSCQVNAGNRPRQVCWKSSQYS